MWDLLLFHQANIWTFPEQRDENTARLSWGFWLFADEESTKNPVDTAESM